MEYKNIRYPKKYTDIFKLWLLGKDNKSISKELKVSEGYVDSTLIILKSKMHNLKESLDMLVALKIIPPIEELVLTEKGIKSFEERKKNFIASKQQKVGTDSQ